MDTWDLKAAAVASTQPLVLATEDQARAVLIELAAGQEYGEHEVREGAWFFVVDGSARFSAGAEQLGAGPGTLVRFDPGERREVRSDAGARLLMLLAPWPGEGHYLAEEVG